ncbi:hypothetical protein RclHR1_12050007 [Rhizophagus clarus]|uniref:Uncharacterized protein n=1 Tax=Rhizophagus clarus TaxID=94130 RepID=A0A2Z6QAT6_9GLOM|nr:hypothetical protein RclHR1_12050007 [Rhizophagus clarus]
MKPANEKEKTWWLTKGSLGSLGVDERRLPLVLARDVTFSQFAKRANESNARRFLDYQNGTVTIIELPTGEHETTHSEFSHLFLNAFNNATPQDGVRDWGSKTPNRCEDVIVVKIGSWKRRLRNNQTRRPLRRLRCLKFCRTATLQQNPNPTTFNVIEEIEFGSVHPNGRESQFCNGPHMKWVTIDCACIYSGCPQSPPLPSFHAVISSQPFPQPQGLPQPQVPYPLQRPGIAIDLYDIQQAIFEAMGPN